MKEIIGGILVIVVAAVWIKEFIKWRKRRSKD
jgi:hypothetical protein